jgi:N-acetylglucosaminyldiphosphoundecaprenol N-acetyl-beta-D-mannosaminyltransferase
MTPQDSETWDEADVLGVQVSAIGLEKAVALALRSIQAGKSGYICASGVHGVMEAQADPSFRSILNGAFLNLPDGMPMTWVGRFQGHTQMDRVFGPDFMKALCQASAGTGYRHFLYGGAPGVAEELKQSLEHLAPGLLVVGTYTPPFRQLTQDEEEDLFNLLRESQPHIVWVGLSTPKQERFMAQYAARMQATLMIGVGAAFDYHTGRINDSPRWIKRAGLQWLHRLLQDPRRLWRRYLRNNPAFLWKIILQMLRQRHTARPRRASTIL